MKKKHLLLTSLLPIALIACASTASTTSTSNNGFDNNGNITLPEDFRLNMVHLGSWYVPEGGASGFHDVYTEKASAEAYRKTGKFPDGAIIVKELRAAESGNYTTGSGVKYETTVKQTFVMVKDSTNRFAATNKSWGDGWGWALFKEDSGNKVNLSSDYKTDCLGCHVPAKDNDWLYTEAYPTLK